MASIFTKIIAGEVLCHKVWEDDGHFAFLDINPWTEGHTLVVPKTEIDYLFGMDEAAYGDLMTAARTVAILLRDKLGCERVCMAVMGYEVPHAHIHLLPTNLASEFPPPAAGASRANLEQILAKITGG